RNRRGLFVGAVMILGIGIASFALYPMLLLIGRSTRILPLNPAQNDLAFPYGRLMAFLFPWADGYPEAVRMFPLREFRGYANQAYFWDTVCYVGWLPIVACAALGARIVIYGKRPKGGWL